MSDVSHQDEGVGSAAPDPWFDAHYRYAAPVVVEWLGKAMNLEGAHLVDFGCGDGIMTLGVARQSGAARVAGVDITAAFELIPEIAREQLGLDSLPDHLEFVRVEAGSPLELGRVDAFFSWSAFEHIDRDQLPGITADLFASLGPGGLVFIQIEPLFHSAYGSHLRRFIKRPWAHLLLGDTELEECLFQAGETLEESELDHAARTGVNENFKRWLFSEYQKLNRLTADELVDLFCAAGFEVDCQSRHQLDEAIPLELKERFPEKDLITNEVQVLFRKP